MKNKMLSVTIGIPAYNEEKNINLLIKRLLLQRGANFVLQKIIIVSDACTDNTETIVQSFKDPRISLITNKKRAGQTRAQNQIIKAAKTDVLIILEADTLPENLYYIDNLLKPMIMNKQVSLVQGNEKPQTAKLFIGKVFEKQFTIYNTEMIMDQKLRSWITSGRGGRALRKNLYRKFDWPKNVPEDVYLHLFCKTKGYLSEFSNEAVCVYKSPESYGDIKKEVKKVNSGQQTMYRYFSKTIIKQMYNKPFTFRIRCAFQFLRTNPLYFFSYCFLLFFILKTKTTFTDILPVTQTTKQVQYEK